MIPLRDTIPAQSFPLVTLTCIGLNLLVFVYELGLGIRLGQFIAVYGFVPAHYFSLSETAPWHLVTRFGPLFSAMFVHGGWLHLLGNMWMLWIFGDNVEDRLGKGRYLAYYLGCGVAATYFHALTAPNSYLPVIGASGAIAGVMGGYFVLFPSARVVTLLPIFFLLPGHLGPGGHLSRAVVPVAVCTRSDHRNRQPRRRGGVVGACRRFCCRGALAVTGPTASPPLSLSRQVAVRMACLKRPLCNTLLDILT